MDDKELADKVAGLEKPKEKSTYEKLMTLTGWKRYLVIIIILLAVILAFEFLDVPTGGLTELPNLFEKNISLPSLLNNSSINLPHLPTPHLLTWGRQIDNPITLEDILCSNIYKYNQTNMSMGTTSCFNGVHYNFTTTSECFCYTSI